MLNAIRLGNFKAARNLNISLAPLTLLSGLNGSGKSTVLQSLAAIRQSYEFGHGQGLVLGGTLVTLGQGSDVLSEGARTDSISIVVIENGYEFVWECKVAPDANELAFSKLPTDRPSFVSASNFQYLQADRIVPRTLYPQAGQQARQLGFLGSHGEFTADFLARNGRMPVSEMRRCPMDGALKDKALWDQIAPTHLLQDQVAGWLQQVSPGVHLIAEPLSGADEVMLQFRYIGTTQGPSKYHRPTNVGFGLTYSLPIIVACLSASAGSLLLIENPEAHLHPNGQVRIGQLLARCATDGVQILLETHSDHVLNGIRLAVKNGELQSDDVKLAYFTRDVESGECFVETPSILPTGDLSNWPDGFFDQWEKSLDALLN